MLGDTDVYPTIPVSDLAATRQFYEIKLELPIELELSGGVFYRCGNGRLFVFPSMGKASGGHTQAGWRVENLATEVERLKANGVVFEEYDYPTLKTNGGIADLDGLRAAWFKDPEGN